MGNDGLGSVSFSFFFFFSNIWVCVCKVRQDSWGRLAHRTSEKAESVRKDKSWKAGSPQQGSCGNSLCALLKVHSTANWPKAGKCRCSHPASVYRALNQVSEDSGKQKRKHQQNQQLSEHGEWKAEWASFAEQASRGRRMGAEALKGRLGQGLRGPAVHQFAVTVSQLQNSTPEASLGTFDQQSSIQDPAPSEHSKDASFTRKGMWPPAECVHGTECVYVQAHALLSRYRILQAPHPTFLGLRQIKLFKGFMKPA